MKKRYSNIELLRIVSMLMITISHLALYTDWKAKNNPSLYNTARLLGFDMWGPIGAVLFFMISGYFARDIDLQSSIRKSLSKTKRIWVKTFLYSADCKI